MAKVHNTRAKVYESTSTAYDEPTDHVESEGERLIKEMVQKQLDTHLNIHEELSRKDIFKRAAEFVPLTQYTFGELSLEEFKDSAQRAAHIEELKEFGLTNDEVQVMLDYEKDLLNEKYKKAEKSALSNRLLSILNKIELAKGEAESSNKEHSCTVGSRLEREIGLCVKPNSEHTKLLHFALSCQRGEEDRRPGNHPINQLKEIEEELFGHLRKRRKVTPVYKLYSTNKTEEKSEEIVYSYKNSKTLWDNKLSCERVIPPLQNKTGNDKHVYTCRPEYLYTIKDKKIVPLSNCKSSGCAVLCQENSDSFVTPNKESISLVPLKVILENRLSLEEIRSLPRFNNYDGGCPSQTLYIKNLSGSVTREDLVSLFGNFENDDGRLTYRLLNGRMKGQAFITCISIEQSKTALETVNGYILKGKPLIIQYGRKQDSQTV